MPKSKGRGKRPANQHCPNCGGLITTLQDGETFEVYRGCANWLVCDYRPAPVE